MKDIFLLCLVFLVVLNELDCSKDNYWFVFF